MLKRILSVVLCLLILLSTAAIAEGDGEWMVVANCKEYITLREEPSTRAEALCRIPLGDEVQRFYGVGNGFAFVYYQGRHGYVLDEYLEFAYDSSIVEDYRVVAYCDEYITLREEPSTRAEAIDRIPLGDEVYCVELVENGFAYVYYMGEFGYVLNSYLAPCPAETVVGDIMYVTNCNEYVTLREEPSARAEALCRIPLEDTVTFFESVGNGFAYVNYDGMRGFVLEEYLAPARSLEGEKIYLTDDAYYNMNLYLSNFTETSLSYLTGGVFEALTAPDSVLVEFAVEHIWFNRENRLEWGEYFNGNNVRVKASRIDSVLDKYLGLSVDDYTPIYLDYRNGYYYWCETGGHLDSGFATVTDCYDLGDNWYRVFFQVHGAGEYWENDVCGLQLYEVSERYPYGYETGSAVLYAGDLYDRSTFRLTEYAQYSPYDLYWE